MQSSFLRKLSELFFEMVPSISKLKKIYNLATIVKKYRINVIFDNLIVFIFQLITGIINVFATTPMWVVNTRLKLQGSTARRGGQSPTVHYDGIFGELLYLIYNDIVY